MKVINKMLTFLCFRIEHSETGLSGIPVSRNDITFSITTWTHGILIKIGLR